MSSSELSPRPKVLSSELHQSPNMTTYTQAAIDITIVGLLCMAGYMMWKSWKHCKSDMDWARFVFEHEELRGLME
jgi:hypothetical protein